jgi:DoxX-like family
MRNAGIALTVLAALFLLMDAGMKVIGATVSVDATVALGFGVEHVRLLGVILLFATLLYAWPRTSILGAILITGYLGGTVAIHLQHHNPLLSHVFFGVYVGVVVWLGLYLRSPALRSLVPVVRAPI